MNYISFNGSETAGGVGFYGPKTNIIRNTPVSVQSPAADTINFRGRDDDKSSAGSILLKGAASIALVIGALGLAHKKDIFSKIKNANVKKYLNKVTEPCYKICHKAKDFVISIYNKIKGNFSK